MYELVLFNNSFVTLFWSSIGSFFLVFPRRLSVTFDIQIDITLEANSEAYSEPCQTSKMEIYTKIVNVFSLLTILVKSKALC